jgi:hypothetical protein
MAEEIRISYGSCQAILTDNLRIKHVLEKFVP